MEICNYKNLIEQLKNLDDNNKHNYKKIIDQCTDIITITSFDGIYIEVNYKFVELIDYSREEVLGKSSIDLNIWLDIQDRYKLVSEIKKNGFIKNLKASFINKHSKIYSGIVFAESMILNEKKLVFLIVENITETKESENLLRDVLNKERELANIVRQAPMAIVVSNLDGTISSFNKATSTLLGYTENELSSINWKELTPNKWHKIEQEKLNKLIKNKTTITYEEKYIKKDGSIIPVELVVSGIFDKNGNISKYIGFITDISKRKEMESILTNTQLLKAVGEMASSVAHDFNNSLQIIVGNIELLQELTKITPESKEYIDTITTAISDATERVKLLQILGDKKEVKTEFNFIDIECLLNEVITQTRPLWRNEKQKKGLNIDFKKSYEPRLKILGNKSELRTVFYNIIKNSIEAMDNGGEIKIETKKIEKNIFIEIHDTGIGMTEETMSNIFQPFYSTKGFGIGRGLGMSGAFNIIKKHHGSISLESILGEGSSLKITLPYNEFQTEFKEDEFFEKYLKKLKILWVDDEEMLQKLAKTILNKLGHKAYIASNGIEALKILDKEKDIDLVITDIGMPDMNGWQLIDKIREKINNNIKIIVLTGWGGEISKSKQINYSVDDVLEKPIKIQDLKNSISKVMNKVN